METNTKKSGATTNSAKGVKPLDMVSDIKDIRENYGKNAIIIKDNIVFRTSTQVLEKGPKSLLDLYLPNYGKMRKFVIKDDGVYELITDTIQTGTQYAQYTISDKVNIDPSKINFDITSVWNKSIKKEIKA